MSGDSVFRIVNPRDPNGYREWLDAWTRTDHREPHSHPAYSLFVAAEGHEPLAALYRDSSGSLILPFGLRGIDLPGAESLRDAATPYGYGGAFITDAPSRDTFWSAWDQWCQAEDVVGLTIRRSVVDGTILPPEGVLVSPLENVVVSVSHSPSTVWQQFKGRVRTDARKAHSLGVSVIIDTDGQQLERFHAIYTETMDRASASDYYYFDLDQFRDLLARMPGNVVAFHAVVEGQIVASELQLLGSSNAYYFLSGATERARACRANALMKFEVIKWLHEQGFAHYVLGGGLRRNDQLFKYKQAYAPSGVKDFLVEFRESIPGATEHLQALRRKLHTGRALEVAEDFIPSYRAPLVAEAIPQ